MHFDVGSRVGEVELNTSAGNFHNGVGFLLALFLVEVDTLGHQVIMPEVKNDLNQLTGQRLAVLNQLHTQRRLRGLTLKLLKLSYLLTSRHLLLIVQNVLLLV